MFIYKLVATLAAIALGVAAAIAFPRLTSEVAAAPTVAEIKSDRLDIRPADAACLKDDWPYGCQWRPLTVRQASPGAANRDRQRFAHSKPGFAVKARLARRGRSVSLTSAPAL